MPKFQHPHMDITVDVPSEKSDEYEAAGWLRGTRAKPEYEKHPAEDTPPATS